MLPFQSVEILRRKIHKISSLTTVWCSGQNPKNQKTTQNPQTPKQKAWIYICLIFKLFILTLLGTSHGTFFLFVLLLAVKSIWARWTTNLTSFRLSEFFFLDIVVAIDFFGSKSRTMTLTWFTKELHRRQIGSSFQLFV